MGTMDRPGSTGDSTPAGPPLLDQTPGRRPEEHKRARPAPVLAGPAFPAAAVAGDAPSRGPGTVSDAAAAQAAQASAATAGTSAATAGVMGDAVGVVPEAALAALIASDPDAGEPFTATSGAACARQPAVPDDWAGWPSDEDIDRLIASMPEDGWADRAAPDGTGGTAVFPFPMADAPWAVPDQCDPAVSLLPGPADLGRVRILQASVPDLPEAPRPANPAHVAWSPVAGADALAHLDPHRLGENDLLDYIHAANRLCAFARAMENDALAVFATRRPPLPSEQPATTAGKLQAGTLHDTGELQDTGEPGPGGLGRDGELGRAGELGEAWRRSRYAAAEIMAVHCVGIGTAHQLLDDAETLANNLPATTALFRDGLLDPVRIKAILAGLENVPADVQTLIEPLFLPGAARTNPRALTRKIRALAQKHHPEPLTERHQRARTQRRVWFTALPDGMAQLSAVLDAAPAKSLYDTLDAWARHAQHEGTLPGGAPSTATTPTGRPSRSLDNYRADTLLDLLHQALHPTTNRAGRSNSGNRGGNTPGGGANGGGSTQGGRANGGGPAGSAARDAAGPPLPVPVAVPEPVPEPRFTFGISAKISVTVPALTLLGHSEEPGYLDGYGPIPPEQARELAAGSYWWERLLTDPATTPTAPPCPKAKPASKTSAPATPTATNSKTTPTPAGPSNPTAPNKPKPPHPPAAPTSTPKPTNPAPSRSTRAVLTVP
ncbi:DUF222 domain-containing protein [Arthrobacter dokdonensis]|uniref:DUF222 domain-containing protein n=1 Tax=Arthrobacter dokdonellae TaxID=2211210 RepID=UPI001013C85D|nr:DUF222 domain-containing protein [Arthrobacter dokdonellae]